MTPLRKLPFNPRKRNTEIISTLAAVWTRDIRIPHVTFLAVTVVTFPSIGICTVSVLFAHIARHVLLGHLARLVPDCPVQNYRHALLGNVQKRCRGELEVVVHGNEAEAAWIEIMDIGMVVETS